MEPLTVESLHSSAVMSPSTYMPPLTVESLQLSALISLCIYIPPLTVETFNFSNRAGTVTKYVSGSFTGL